MTKRNHTFFQRYADLDKKKYWFISRVITNSSIKDVELSPDKDLLIYLIYSQ